jgi:uncharacterized membrane protein
MFQKNESGLDRVVRTVVGGGLVISALTTFGLAWTKPLGILFGLVGVVLLFTAATGSCLIYSVLGVRTAKQQ